MSARSELDQLATDRVAKAVEMETALATFEARWREYRALSHELHVKAIEAGLGPTHAGELSDGKPMARAISYRLRQLAPPDFFNGPDGMASVDPKILAVGGELAAVDQQHLDGILNSV